MFVEIGGDSKNGYLVIDTEFEEPLNIFPSKMVEQNLNIGWIEGIIDVYERKGKNVAGNLLRVLRKHSIDRHEIYCKHSAKYAAYAPDIEKLLLLV
jgi:hypothetical protein